MTSEEGMFFCCMSSNAEPMHFFTDSRISSGCCSAHPGAGVNVFTGTDGALTTTSKDLESNKMNLDELVPWSIAPMYVLLILAQQQMAKLCGLIAGLGLFLSGSPKPTRLI